jgi:hypothetical protein
MDASLSQSSTTDWVLTIRTCSPCASRPRAVSPHVDEDRLAALLAETVRSLLRRSPTDVAAEHCEAPALSFL